MFLASGYAVQRTLSWSTSHEIGRFVAGRASTLGPWLDLLSFSSCGCCRPAIGHTVRGMNEKLGWLVFNGTFSTKRLYRAIQREGTRDEPRASSNPALGGFKGSAGSCPRVLHVFFPAVSRGLFLVLGRLGGLE